MEWEMEAAVPSLRLPLSNSATRISLRLHAYTASCPDHHHHSILGERRTASLTRHAWLLHLIIFVHTLVVFTHKKICLKPQISLRTLNRNPNPNPNRNVTIAVTVTVLHASTIISTSIPWLLSIPALELCPVAQPSSFPFFPRPCALCTGVAHIFFFYIHEKPCSPVVCFRRSRRGLQWRGVGLGSQSWKLVQLPTWPLVSCHLSVP
mmetsp:Transcript_38757/g.121498  ORF Transcript_38757/g.121498 Transcript_38757/m.121498 type:complete len:207 (+) Transcript_38757:416-1036(+)